jgi:single-stranded-DNA-specific exonuclease
MKMLLSKDPLEINRLVDKLVYLNNKRKEIEHFIFVEAMATINSQKLQQNKFIFVYGEKWNEGIIGIIAGKIKDCFNKPTFVVTFNEKGEGKGSARSVDGINIAHIINESKNRGIIKNGGGHSLAGGFSINVEEVGNFYDFLRSFITKEIENSIRVDCVIPSCSDLKILANNVSVLEPFGKGVERPIFCMKNVKIESYKLTNDEKHMMVFMNNGYGNTIRSIIFNIKNKDQLIQSIKNSDYKSIDIAFSIKSNDKYGPSIIIEDARLSKNS